MNVADHKIKTYTDYAQLGLAVGEVTIQQIVDVLPMGSTLYANNAPDGIYAADRPTSSVYGLLIARKITGNSCLFEWHKPLGGTGLIEGIYRGAYRTLSTPSWSGWVPIATATPPQWYNLPLAAGISPNTIAQYCKDQIGRVHLRGRVSNTAVGAVFATLPAGYRPSLYENRILCQSSGASSGGSCRCEVKPSGEMVIASSSEPATLANWVDIACEFYVG